MGYLSTSSMVEAHGALPMATAPAASREPCHAVARIAYQTATLPVLAPVSLIAAGNATVGTSEDRGIGANSGWLGVIGSDEAGSQPKLAAEMADLFTTYFDRRSVAEPCLERRHDTQNDPAVATAKIKAGTALPPAGQKEALRKESI